MSQELERRLQTLEARLRALELQVGAVRDIELEVELAQKLKDVRVIVSRDPNLGPVAARTFESYVRPAEASQLAENGKRLGIGFSGGRTIRAMVSCITQEYTNLSIYPLSCPGLPQDVPFSVNTIIGLFCMKYEGRGIDGRHLPVDPEFFGKMSSEGQEQINSQMLKDVEESVHYAFTGIGSLEESAALSKLAKGFDIELNSLIEEGLVGDMLYRGMKETGEIMRIPELDKRIIGVWPTALRRIRDGHQYPLRLVVGVAGGREKVKAIYAACQARFINVLVTDEGTARRLLALVTETQ